MNLYRIDFWHYGPKDSQHGTWGFILAESDEHLYEKLCAPSSPTYWSECDDEVLTVWDDETEDTVEAPLRDLYLKYRGNTFEEPAETYYGVTQWEWSLVAEGLDYSSEIVHSLARIGIFHETIWTDRKIAIIAAVGQKNHAIGLKGKLPWKLNTDLKRFKALTTGHTVVMGRKTWESLPANFRPLPNRDNIVLTNTRGYEAEGATVAHNLTEAFLVADMNKTIFVIGGTTVFDAAVKNATEAHITRVDYDGPFDAQFFAHFHESLWVAETTEVIEADAKNDHRSEYTYYRSRHLLGGVPTSLTLLRG